MLCVDIGSTWTKAALVDADGTLLHTGQHPTTPPEVLDGVAELTGRLGAAGARTLVCSSAGGGLRLAVVGQEPLVSAEAGTRVALSAGARVVHVAAGELTPAGVRALRAAAPDVVLLVGGTDGGDARCLLHNARRLAAARVTQPIVLAGNAAVADAALALLRATGRRVTVAPNVLPDIGELRPEPARNAIREVFLRHVIGGKGLSRGQWFRRLVRTVTPDAVLTGVAALAAVREQPLLVVDVGGATTDVYSAADIDDGPVGAAGASPQRRTVEGDLGLRSSAAGLVTAARAEGLVDAAEVDRLQPAALRRASDPAWVPLDGAEWATETRLAALAARLAVRRHLHARDGRLGPRGPDLVVLSGGVFRHADDAGLHRVVGALRADPALRAVLRHSRVVVDVRYVLAPAGLLAGDGRGAAAQALLRSGLA